MYYLVVGAEIIEMLSIADLYIPGPDRATWMYITGFAFGLFPVVDVAALAVGSTPVAP